MTRLPPLVSALHKSPYRWMGATAPILLLTFALTMAVLPAAGQDAVVQLHGFGGWVYGKTNGTNNYLAGLPDGNYRQSDFALNISATVTERFRIVAQGSIAEGTNGVAADLSYAFAEWKFSDNLALRAGQVKQPFGISAEVFAVGTLRPFLALPQGVYGPIGFVGDSYKGLGLTGWHGMGRWTLRYDVYVGGIDLEEYLAPEAFLRGKVTALAASAETESTRDVVGTRLVLSTPVDGLSFGTSAYTGKEIGSTQRTVFGLHGVYLRGPWSVRSEYAHETVKNDLIANGFYFEMAYQLNSHWQVGGQYDRLTTDLPGANVVAPSLLNHKEVAVTLNYWLHPSFVFKLEYHNVDGNRFAGPDPATYELLVPSSLLNAKTNLVQFGAQFSF